MPNHVPPDDVSLRHDVGQDVSHGSSEHDLRQSLVVELMRREAKHELDEIPVGERVAQIHAQPMAMESDRHREMPRIGADELDPLLRPWMAIGPTALRPYERCRGVTIHPSRWRRCGRRPSHAETCKAITRDSTDALAPEHPMPATMSSMLAQFPPRFAHPPDQNEIGRPALGARVQRIPGRTGEHHTIPARGGDAVRMVKQIAIYVGLRPVRIMRPHVEAPHRPMIIGTDHRGIEVETRDHRVDPPSLVQRLELIKDPRDGSELSRSMRAQMLGSQSGDGGRVQPPAHHHRRGLHSAHPSLYGRSKRRAEVLGVLLIGVIHDLIVGIGAPVSPRGVCPLPHFDRLRRPQLAHGGERRLAVSGRLQSEVVRKVRVAERVGHRRMSQERARFRCDEQPLRIHRIAQRAAP